MSQSNMADGLSAGRNIIVMSLNHFLGSSVSQTVNHRVRNPASDASQVQMKTISNRTQTGNGQTERITLNFRYN